jgi:hypothetical protein
MSFRLVRALRKSPGAHVLVRYDQRHSRLDAGGLERARKSTPKLTRPCSIGWTSSGGPNPALDWIVLAGGAVRPAPPHHDSETQEPWLAETYESP